MYIRELPTGCALISLDRYLSDLPLLHTWDNGATWSTGGFNREIFEAIHPFVTEGARILETGAGNSTIFFLLHKPSRLVSIAPETDLFNRIRSYCDQNSIDRSCAEVVVGRSEWILPRLANQQFDFVLLDGCHNWPVVFVDFCYGMAMLRKGGLLMLDDLQLHSVKELARMLNEQPEFSLILQHTKAALFRKNADVRELPEWINQPYIVRKSGEYNSSGDPFFIS